MSRLDRSINSRVGKDDVRHNVATSSRPTYSNLTLRSALDEDIKSIGRSLLRSVAAYFCPRSFPEGCIQWKAMFEVLPNSWRQWETSAVRLSACSPQSAEGTHIADVALRDNLDTRVLFTSHSLLGAFYSNVVGYAANLVDVGAALTSGLPVEAADLTSLFSTYHQIEARAWIARTKCLRSL